MSISTHVLDTSIGRPAVDVRVRLSRRDGSAWRDLWAGTTNADGRVPLLASDESSAEGMHRLTFDAGAYFASRGVDAFYREIAIDFVIRDASAHHHVPLLLSPFGYSTYRGS